MLPAEFLSETEMEDEGFHSVYLDPISTGLPMYIWVSGQFSDRIIAPRIKMSRKYTNNQRNWDDICIISINDQPQITHVDAGDIINEDLKAVFDWLKLNKDILLTYWYAEFSTVEFLKKLEKYQSKPLSNL